MKRIATIFVFSAAAAFAGAGQLTINANAFDELYDASTNVLSQDTEWQPGTFTGTSMTHSETANAYVQNLDPNFNVTDWYRTINTGGAIITSETSGELTDSDTFDFSTPNLGAIAYTQQTITTFPTVDYKFHVDTTSLLTLHALAQATGDATFGTIGLLTNYVLIDGGPEAIPDINFPYDQTWGIFIGAGDHDIALSSYSNMSEFGDAETISMNENLFFSTQAVPEPAPFAALGLGALGLLIRRRRR